MTLLQIDAFTADFSGAHDRAAALDARILGNASAISAQYADLVALATRQAVSALDFTVGTDAKGNVLPWDVKLFMKNIGTDTYVLAVYLSFFPFLWEGGALMMMMDGRMRVGG